MAVGHLHQKGICHRDLKPDNVKFDPKTKKIKLMDFNAAKKFMEQEENEDSSSSGLDLSSDVSPELPTKTIRLQIFSEGNQQV